MKSLADLEVLRTELPEGMRAGASNLLGMPRRSFRFVFRLASAAFVFRIAGVFLSAPASAAMEKSPPGRAGVPVRRETLTLLQLPSFLQTRLKLTAPQVRQLMTLQNSFRAVARKAMSDAQQGRGDRRDAMRAMTAAQTIAEREAEAVLQPGQRTVFQGLQALALRLQPLGRAGLAALAVESLTDDQKTKLQALASRSESKRGGIFGEMAHSNSRNPSYAKFAALDTENDRAVRQVLHAEQWKPYDAALRAQGVPSTGR